MKITNKHNLPESIVRAVENDGYSKGDAWRSVTQLIKSPRIVRLEQLHWDELEDDASDRIWSLLGQAIHVILERSETHAVAEKRLTMDYAVKDKAGQEKTVKISGAMDRLAVSRRTKENVDAHTIQDYKVCSTYAIEGKEEWHAQLNLYKILCEANAIHVDQLQLVLILRDWRRGEAKMDPTYPQRPVLVQEVPVWDSLRANSYLLSRVKAHLNAELGRLPHCTPEEMWKRPDKWAVYPEGGARCVKLADTQEAAYEYIQDAKRPYRIDKRLGARIKCDSYCLVKDQCKALNDGQWEGAA